MIDAREVFGVIWIDAMLGPLTLGRPNASSAIASARTIRAKGAGKVHSVRAVHVAAGSNSLITLSEETTL